MIALALPWLPPSDNHAYFNNPHTRGRTLTDTGRRFKLDSALYLAQRFSAELGTMRPNRPYLVVLRLYFTELECSTYGQPRGAGSRYKKIDATNRRKLVEDVLKEVSKVDDSNTMTFICAKRQGPEEKTELFIWDLESETSPFDDALNSLPDVPAVQPDRTVPTLPGRGPKPFTRGR